jgi:hypothetical protein
MAKMMCLFDIVAPDLPTKTTNMDKAEQYFSQNFPYRIPHILEFVEGFRYELKVDTPHGREWVQIRHKGQYDSEEILRALCAGRIRVPDYLHNFHHKNVEIKLENGTFAVDKNLNATVKGKEEEIRINQREARQIGLIIDEMFRGKFKK